MAKLRLHLGCGKRVLKGWVNSDLKRPPKGTKPVDALEPWPYKSGSAEAVYCEDLFEHFSQPGQYKFLAEACRVLCEGGIIRINVPDAIWSLRNWVMTKGTPEKDGMKCLDMEKEPYRRGHKLLPTPSYLWTMLREFGFPVVRVRRKNESAIPDFPGDSRPLEGTRGPAGNLIVEAAKCAPH